MRATAAAIPVIATLLTAVVGAIACSSNSIASDGSAIADDRDITSTDVGERVLAEP